MNNHEKRWETKVTIDKCFHIFVYTSSCKNICLVDVV